MIVEPELRVADFAKAGADIISVHAEGASTIHLHRTVNQIKDLGCKAGVVLNPGTPPDVLEYVLDCVDLILVMSVNPGFGGQSFIENQEKIAKIKAMCDAKGVNPWIEVDGGVSPANAYKVISAGANAPSPDPPSSTRTITPPPSPASRRPRRPSNEKNHRDARRRRHQVGKWGERGRERVPEKESMAQAGDRPESSSSSPRLGIFSASSSLSSQRLPRCPHNARGRARRGRWRSRAFARRGFDSGACGAPGMAFPAAGGARLDGARRVSRRRTRVEGRRRPRGAAPPARRPARA